MFNYFARKFFGSRNDRIIKSLQPLVVRINGLESTYRAMSDDELRGQTALFRTRLANGESLSAIQPEAFAVCREAARRVHNMRHFDVQLIGGAVLNLGKIAEMRTGEGKTLMATLPAYLNALTGKGVHVVTVNDYLAKRDSEWMGRIYRFLGLSVGVVLPHQGEQEKLAAYRADITYGQNNEFGFDYLRDNMKFKSGDMFQRGHHFAIVDEVDSILIDEARTPLIISGPTEDSTELYVSVNKVLPSLQKEKHFTIDLKSKEPSLNEEGIATAEKLLGVENLYDPKNISLVHHLQQALVAHHTKQRDVDYVVKDGQIIIVDEFTGRLMQGRVWSNGLHQAIEAKEGLKIKRENQTLASVTFQNFFRLYEKLSGMTGTADTEAAEFNKIYKLEVVVIPTNRAMIRVDESDRVFKSRREKFNAVLADIKEVHAAGQPILVGTISIEQSEALSEQLRISGIPHNVLNAKQHEREAEIIAQAGRFGGVTIATNMAGRGTDIVLGGNPEYLAAAETGTRDPQDPAFQAALTKFKQQCDLEKEKVTAAGGLFVIGTERHEARRIDNQLRGRSGRQGDPGRSRFYVSLEDDLMLRFGGEKLQAVMQRLGWEEGMMIDGRIISGSIERAQTRVEALHFEMRKNVLEYDDVMNKQRQVIYNLRGRMLRNEGVKDEVLAMIDDLLEESITTVCAEEKKPTLWELPLINERVKFLTNAPIALPADAKRDVQSIFDYFRDEMRALYEKRRGLLEEKLKALELISKRDFGGMRVGFDAFEEKPFSMDTAEQDAILETIDRCWLQHLQAMDELREGIHLRGYGQKNPLHEYQREGFLLFQDMIRQFKEVVVRKLFYYEVPDPEELIAHIEEEQRRQEERQRNMQTVHQSVLADAGTSEGALGEKAAQEKRAKMEEQRKLRRKMK